MGSGASLNVKDNEKLNEEGCRSIAAELFDLATFNALKDEEGNVTMNQLMDPRNSLRAKAEKLRSFHLNEVDVTSIEKVLPYPEVHEEDVTKPDDTDGSGEDDISEDEVALQRREYESKIVDLELRGRRILLGCVEDDFEEDLVTTSECGQASSVEKIVSTPDQRSSDKQPRERSNYERTTDTKDDASNNVHGEQENIKEEIFLGNSQLDWGPLRGEIIAAMAFKDFALSIVRLNGMALKYACLKLRNDRDVVVAAVTQNSDALKFASAHLQADDEVTEAAARSASQILSAEDQKKLKTNESIATAIVEHWVSFRHAPKSIRNNDKFAMAAIVADGGSLEFASNSQKDNREIVMAAVRKDGKAALPHISKQLQNDENIVTAAVAHCYSSNRYAKLSQVVESLRANKGIVKSAVAKEGSSALRVAAAALQNDKDIVRAAVKREGRSLRFASPALRADKDIVLHAVRQDGCALYYAATKLQEDREVALVAVKQNFQALYYVSATLKSDRSVVLAAIESGGSRGWEALPFAGRELRADRGVVLEAAKSSTDAALRFATPSIRFDPDFIEKAKQAASKEHQDIHEK